MFVGTGMSDYSVEERRRAHQMMYGVAEGEEDVDYVFDSEINYEFSDDDVAADAADDCDGTEQTEPVQPAAEPSPFRGLAKPADLPEPVPDTIVKYVCGKKQKTNAGESTAERNANGSMRSSKP